MHPDKRSNKKGADKKDKTQQQPEKNKDQNNTREAYNEAQRDIDLDADLGIHSPNEDLDEGESARLGEDKTDLV